MSDSVLTAIISSVASIILTLLGVTLKQRRQEGNVSIKPTNGLAGQRSTEYWQLEFRRIFEQVVDERIVPRLEEILRRRRQ